MNRVRSGWCAVSNPFNSNQVTKISLKPEDVDAVVFWSKNPAPLIEHLSELDTKGLHYYFQYTVNDYPEALEPHIPPLKSRIKSFIQISQHLGPQRVIWRYDPIIISNKTDYEFHLSRFDSIASSLKGYTIRLMVSVVDLYQKTDRRLSKLETELGYVFDRNAVNSQEMIQLMRDLAKVAASNGIAVYSCAEEVGGKWEGINPGSCIDANLINTLWPDLHIRYKKDPYQRDPCLCAASKDIGMNDTCLHGCSYCYSTTHNEVAHRRYSEHDPDSPLLWQNPVNKRLDINKPDPQQRLL